VIDFLYSLNRSLQQRKTLMAASGASVRVTVKPDTVVAGRLDPAARKHANVIM
jgi:hypothetical protein